MNKTYHWAVIGAGPAGIATVGKLLDNGVCASDILWCDPHFTVGDLGMHWANVSSNTKAKLFTHFLNASPSFAYDDNAPNCVLRTLDPEDTCTLKYMVEPLQQISEHLSQKVDAQKVIIRTMALKKRLWLLHDDVHTYQSRNVILATGALPSSLNYPGVEVIPFDKAIDKERLLQEVHSDDTYAVFGSSHSAIIIVRHLVELGVKRVINFYRSPCRYALDMGDWILFDNTGLKGQTAAWAKEYIDGTLPENLSRYNTSEPNIARYLPQCNKVIYAVGFEPRNSILIGDYEDAKHNPYVGIIGPGLFGFGIAYPELKKDPFGNGELQVGLWKFMTYLERVLPIWFKYHT